MILTKNNVIKMISEKLSDERIVIGGNKEAYKRKYHLKYTQKIISNVVNALLDVIIDATENGNVIKMDGYFKIEPKYYKEKMVNVNGLNGLDIVKVPERYKVKFSSFKRLNMACDRLLKKQLSEKSDHQSEKENIN